MFTWDPSKAIINFEKHDVSFEEAATVFGDENGLDWQDLEHSQVEDRFKRLGAFSRKKIILVVYTLRRRSDGKETIRIISARKANRKEKKAYER